MKAGGGFAARSSLLNDSNLSRRGTRPAAVARVIADECQSDALGSFRMAPRSYPSLPADLRAQLMSIEPSKYLVCEYRPCRAILHTGEVRDFIYAVGANGYMAVWGVWPEDDP